MINSKYIKSVVIAITCALIMTTGSVCFDKATAESTVMPAAKPVTEETVNTTETNLQPWDTIPALRIVSAPKAFLGKKVVINAKFDKFSTLGLDYKPALRSSEEYISFLIKRDDTTHDIPLSEMKLFIKRTEAEKFIDLKTNDEIQITGTVFSDALGDVWVDVEKLVVIKKAPEKDGVNQ